MKIKEFDPNATKYEEVENLDEAEALVTTYPNSSKAWILYLVHYLKLAEVNKARVIAKRALETINFREDNEKLNVWKAFLNLENQYGSEKSLDLVLKEALQYQDQLKIYKHVLDMFIDSGKHEELEKTCKIVLKKFKHDKEVWVTLGTYYMKLGKYSDARKILERSLQCLHTKDHADIMGKFAHLEYKFGQLEKSLAMYEDIISKYPKRNDIKTVYNQVKKSALGI